MMSEGFPCGRPTHSAPVHDEEPVCLMHSRDPEKSVAEFQKEFELILEMTGDRSSDFTRFVFPIALYVKRKFSAKCIFRHATFAQDANFSDAKFTQKADFGSAMFSKKAYFRWATFTQDANFTGATFTREADFTNTIFGQRASFEGAKFHGAAQFRESDFRQDSELFPGPVFSLAEFLEPRSVVFHKTNLGQALFHNCDVTKMNFSSVEWRKRKSSGKRMVFEEVVELEAAEALKPGKNSTDERDYGSIAELYQQLKKNYDERKDYWTAGDFHYGEMEMKRLHSQSTNPLRRWLHRHLGLVAWYKYASQYGESYVRPLVCLVLVLLLFTFLFPWPGLDWNEAKFPPVANSKTHQSTSQTATPELSYGNLSEYVKAYPGRRWLGRPAFFGHSLMTALSVAGFQKELKYEPNYPWGRALALLELLLTSTLIALFLLAVRRQFRR